MFFQKQIAIGFQYGMSNHIQFFMSCANSKKKRIKINKLIRNMFKILGEHFNVNYVSTKIHAYD